MKKTPFESADPWCLDIIDDEVNKLRKKGEKDSDVSVQDMINLYSGLPTFKRLITFPRMPFEVEEYYQTQVARAKLDGTEEMNVAISPGRTILKARQIMGQASLKLEEFSKTYHIPEFASREQRAKFLGVSGTVLMRAEDHFLQAKREPPKQTKIEGEE
jgi:hypothetical protein